MKKLALCSTLAVAAVVALATTTGDVHAHSRTRFNVGVSFGSYGSGFRLNVGNYGNRYGYGGYRGGSYGGYRGGYYGGGGYYPNVPSAVRRGYYGGGGYSYGGNYRGGNYWPNNYSGWGSNPHNYWNGRSGGHCYTPTARHYSPPTHHSTVVYYPVYAPNPAPVQTQYRQQQTNGPMYCPTCGTQVNNPTSVYTPTYYTYR